MSRYADNATAIALGVTDHMKGSVEIAAFIATRVPVLYRDTATKFLGIHADGPIAVVEEEMTATLPNGLPCRLNYCFIFECRNNRVARMREYMDTMSGHRQVFGDVRLLQLCRFRAPLEIGAIQGGLEDWFSARGDKDARKTRLCTCSRGTCDQPRRCLSWVKMRNTRTEHVSSGLSLITDVPLHDNNRRHVPKAPRGLKMWPPVYPD
jgi:uncharacterized protein